jgi:hypothetical protein
MAADVTPPRNRLIALYGALAVLTLLALEPAFDAYFDSVHAEAEAYGLALGQDLADVEDVRLEWALREPDVERAMARLVSEGRAGVPALQPVVASGQPQAPVRAWNLAEPAAPRAPMQAEEAAERIETTARDAVPLPPGGDVPAPSTPEPSAEPAPPTEPAP